MHATQLWLQWSPENKNKLISCNIGLRKIRQHNPEVEIHYTFLDIPAKSLFPSQEINLKKRRKREKLYDLPKVIKHLSGSVGNRFKELQCHSKTMSQQYLLGTRSQGIAWCTKKEIHDLSTWLLALFKSQHSLSLILRVCCMYICSSLCQLKKLINILQSNADLNSKDPQWQMVISCR